MFQGSEDVFSTPAAQNALGLLYRVRDFLDFLEPYHSRQFMRAQQADLVFWNYSFSIIRWRHAIRFFWPDLEYALDLHEKFHHTIHQSALRELESWIASGDLLSTAIWLNLWYEGISDMEDTSLVDVPAKEHALLAIRHHLLHIYRRVLPTFPARGKSKEDSTAENAAAVFRTFPQTSEFMPAEYRTLPDKMAIAGRAIMIYQKAQPRPGRTIGMLIESRPSAGPPEPFASLFAVRAYLPPKLAAIFEPDRATWDGLEKLAQETILHMPASIRRDILDFSFWALSVGLRACLDQFVLQSCSEAKKRMMLGSMVSCSLRLWVFLGDLYDPSGASEGLPTSLESFIMYDREALEAFLIESLAGDDMSMFAIKNGTFKRRTKKA